MGAGDPLVAQQVGGLTLTRHPARSKKARPVTSGRQCIATGPLLGSSVAGIVSGLTIHCRDAAGQRRTTGGDVVTVTLKPEGTAPVDAKVIDSSGNRNHGSYEKYAGGVELRRVQSRRPKIVKMLSASEQIVDANFLRFCKWKKEFEQKNGRVPNKADIMLSGEEILNLARRLGEFQG